MAASRKPLYRTIADSIRERIAAGDLPPGAPLDSLREAAEAWGVNLHTVRHAYAALEREGLVDVGRGRRGTRVAGIPGHAHCPAASDEPGGNGQVLERLVEAVCSQARDARALSPEALLSTIEALRIPAGLPRVHFVECTLDQAEQHAAEIRTAFHVDARPWPLQAREPPAGPLLTTFFHYNDVCRAWPGRIDDLHCLSIQPDEAIVRRVAGLQHVTLCEFDEPTARALREDLAAILPEDTLIRIELADGPETFVTREGTEGLQVFPPRVWFRLSRWQQTRQQVVPLVYRINPAAAAELAGQLGWRPREGKELARVR